MTNTAALDPQAVAPEKPRWFRRALIGLLALLLAAVLLVIVILYTRPGLSLALSLADTFGGVQTRYNTLNGSLAGFTANDLEVRAGDTRVLVGELSAYWSPMKLLGGLLDVQSLKVNQLSVFLPAASADPEPAQAPNVAPPDSLTLPIDVQLRDVQLSDAQIIPAAGETTQVDSIMVQASLESALWDLKKLEVALPDLALTLNAQTTPSWPYEHLLSLQLEAGANDSPLAARWQSSGNLAASIGSLNGQQADQTLNLDPLKFGYREKRWNLETQGNAGPLDVELSAAADGAELFAANLKATIAQLTDTASAQVALDASGPFQKISGRLNAEANGLEPTGNVQASSRFSLNQFSELGLREIAVVSADGRLDGDADLWLEAPLRAEADLRVSGVNLQRLHPQLTGTLQGAVTANSAMSDSGPQTQLRVNFASRELKPAVNLAGDLQLNGSNPQSGQLTLNAGEENQLEVALSSPESLTINLALNRLQSVWPDLGGAINGLLTANPEQLINSADQPALLAESGAWPPLRGQLALADITLNDIELSQMALELGPKKSAISLTGLDLGSLLVKESAFTLDGTPLDHQFVLSADTDRGNLNLDGAGQWRDEAYGLVMENLTVAPEGMPALTNKGPWQGRLSATSQSLQRGCLAGSGIEACVAALAEPDALALDLELDVANEGLRALNWRNWWPGAPAGLEILTPLSADVALSANATEDNLNLELTFAGLEVPVPDQPQVNGQTLTVKPLRDLQVVIRGSTQSSTVKATAGVADGTLEANGTLTQLLDNPTLDVTTNLNADNLNMLSVLLPDLDLEGGPLTVNIQTVGPASQPEVSGTARVDQVTVGLPGLNVQPVVNMSLDMPTSGAGMFEGSLVSGAGSGQLSGSIDIGETQRVSASLKGDKLLLADSDTLSLTASPDLSLQIDGAQLRVSGEVVVDDGLIALTATSSTAQASPDIVIVDAETPADTVASAGTELDVRVRIPDPLQVTGYGLKGEISGSLRVRQKPGVPMLGNGQLLLTGTYGAFGQKLTIERGTLNYVETPLNDPAIDFFAYREVGDAKVGVRVTGRASSLSAALESEPPMNESDQLAMLVLGERNSGDGLDESQSDQLASAALGLALSQGNKRLGALGESGSLPQVSLTQELGGLAVAIGKQISPNLYIGYTVDLLEPIQLIRLRYRISDLWTAESELGQESRVAFRYRLER
ncbi:MAG: translocation/assembly module TamB domain-containing protein [Lysobacterales bacterium]